MSYILRQYQLEAVEKGVEFLQAKHKYNGIIVLPTGAGKSLVIGNIIKELGQPVLVFQPSKEILEQNHAKYISYGLYASIFSASIGEKIVSDVTFATIGSVINQPHLFTKFKYVIIDECHYNLSPKSGTFNNFLKLLPDAKILGLTATPYRLTTDGYGGSILKFLTRTRPRVFEKVIYAVQTKELFDAGYLSKTEYYPVKGFDKSKLQPNSTGADYSDKSVKWYYHTIDFQNKICNITQRLLAANRKNVLVFTRFVEEAQYVCDNIPGSAIVTGTTPKKERERILTGFRNGSIKVVVNCAVLLVGFDYPELETVVMARPTMSLALWYQALGRGIRPHPDKKSVWIVDMCQNLEFFGKLEDLQLIGADNSYQIVSNGNPLTNVYFKK